MKSMEDYLILSKGLYFFVFLKTDDLIEDDALGVELSVSVEIKVTEPLELETAFGL